MRRLALGPSLLVIAPALLVGGGRDGGVRGALAEEAGTAELIGAGAAMAVPTYFLGVAWHEGTHALVARSFGAEIVELRLLPGTRDGHFYFGYTRWRGRLSRAETAFVLFAPKLTDLAILGGYTALWGAGALPDHDYGALALTVLATGAWVDFSKDIFSWNVANDLVKIHNLYGRRSEWRRLPYRLLHLGVSLAAAYVLYRSYDEIFGSSGSGSVLNNSVSPVGR